MNYKIPIFVFLLYSLLCLTGCVENDTIRFAWLSDTHISGTSRAADALRQVVNDVNAMDSLDFVIVSGDITDLNIGNNLAKAKEILDSLNKPYYIIPGNHDTKWTDTADKNFSRFWGDDKFFFRFKGYTFIGLHQGPVLRMMDGHFSPNDLNWLDSLLTYEVSKSEPLIFVTHYPLNQTVDNVDDFFKVIKHSNIRLFLNGHGHRNKKAEYAGIPAIMGRSTLRRKDIPPGYNIVKIAHDTSYFYERRPETSYIKNWAVIPLGNKNVLKFDTSQKSPDYQKKYPQVKLEWVYDTKALIASSPVVDGDKLFIGDGRGILHALSVDNGEEIWRYNAAEEIYATVAADSNSVVFPDLSGRVYCLNASDGSLRWKLKTDMPNFAVPLIHRGIVYIGGSDHIFRAIRLSSGDIVWQYDRVEGYVEARPFLYKKLVVFGAWDKKLYALDKDDGLARWIWQEGRPHILYSPAACWPVAARNKIFIVAPDRYFTAIDYKSGKTIWRTNRYKVRETIGISEDSSRVYARCMRDTVIAVDTKGNSFSICWEKNLDFGYDITPSALVEKDGSVFWGTKNGLIIAFDGRTGALEWKYKFGNTFIGNLAPFHQNRVAVSSMDGRIAVLTFPVNFK